MTSIIALLKLTKPGVLLGNALTVPAGFFVATAGGEIDWLKFLAVMVGSTLIIASACVLNNYLDQDIDRVMERTKKRPLITGQVAGSVALVFSIVLGLAGLISLFLWTNMAVVIAGTVGFITYVWLYGAWSKRRSVHGTLVGSVSGAIPILAGYLAVQPRLDLGAILVFMAVFLWQQPEFYSISLYCRQEYQAANIPVISVVKGAQAAKNQILLYIIAFALVNVSLSLFGYSGYIFGLGMFIFSLAWASFGWHSRHTLDDHRWGKLMFRGAMISILLLSIFMPLSPYLP